MGIEKRGGYSLWTGMPLVGAGEHDTQSGYLGGNSVSSRELKVKS